MSSSEEENDVLRVKIQMRINLFSCHQENDVMRVKRQMRINNDPLSLSVFLSSSEEDEENDVMCVKIQMRINSDLLYSDPRCNACKETNAN